MDVNRRLVIYSSKLHRGGAEKHLVLLINQLLLIGYEIHLVITQRGGSYQRLLADGVKVHSFPVSFPSYTLSLIAGAFTLCKVIRQINPVISYSIQDGPNIINLLVGTFVCSRRVARVIEVQNNPETELSKSGLLKLYFRLCKRLYPVSNGFISLSKGVESAYLRQIPGLGAVDRRVIHNIGFTKSERMLKKGRTNIWRFLAVGRLTGQKDYATLIQAVRLVKAHLAEHGTPIVVHLDILGDGEMLENLRCLVKEAKLEENIIFRGFVDDPDDFYKHADIFILSSRWEGFGNVIVEAMARGLPVISTDCDFGPAEIIEQPASQGLLVPVGDADAIARNIMMVMNDRTLYEKLSEGGFQRASEFSADKIALKYHACFESITRG